MRIPNLGDSRKKKNERLEFPWCSRVPIAVAGTVAASFGRPRDERQRRNHRRRGISWRRREITRSPFAPAAPVINAGEGLDTSIAFATTPAVR
ncbi:hypothetical protein DEO72_LG8g2883 [Vigna unguiculata]|uniref:Uncharacterized protein n=1 Tax=Vigna unguiculata TaxID=3917 RepID=A0A4D6MW49_VIGUN|nr:hypothetical protein DEO72_LG8g2881 [Vigna unguiculata]QCE04842.1 hypothetical protein DEO72_LG8g2883 [Vigna unguiculata]